MKTQLKVFHINMEGQGHFKTQILYTEAELCWWPRAFLAAADTEIAFAAAAAFLWGTNRSYRVSEAQFCSHHTRPTYCMKSNKTGDKSLQLKNKKKWLYYMTASGHSAVVAQEVETNTY